jgi:hypothetical protein
LGFFVLMKKIFTSKKFIILLVIIIAIVVGISLIRGSNKATVNGVSTQKAISVDLNRTFLFPTYTNQGKLVDANKIKFKITTIDKTSQVLVKDQIFTAKNNKMFLIVNLSLKNDSTATMNVIPGDLVRLSVAGSDDNKFAPDLHNNVVSVAAISTKMDRVGFVIPADAKDFTLYVGEIQKAKEPVAIHFSS